MDRTKAPAYKEIENINFIQPQIKTLSNDLELIVFKVGSQEITKIELIFDAGTIWQSKNLIASTTNAMLQEGSKNFSAEEIAERLFISPKTVENHRTNIMNKLDLHNSMDLVRFAARLGLIDVDLWKG